MAYPPNKISKTVLKMQAFYTCFLKFCLALNSYKSRKTDWKSEMKKKTGYFFLKFFIRAIIGMALIFIINKYVLPADSSINVGLNPMTFLTSGTLGIPGVCLLYSITWYQFM